MRHIDPKVCLNAMSLQVGRSVNCPTCRVKVPVQEMAYVHAGASSLQAREVDKDREPSEADIQVEGSYGTKVSCLTFLVTSQPHSLFQSQRQQVPLYPGTFQPLDVRSQSEVRGLQSLQNLSSSDIAEPPEQYNLHNMQNTASLDLHLVQRVFKPAVS